MAEGLGFVKMTGELATFKQVAEHVVGNAPDERNHFIVGDLVHGVTTSNVGTGWDACKS